MSARKQDPDRRIPDAAVDDAAARLAAIVEAAEQAASKVIDDAERQARQQLEDARERADGIVAERLRELADELDAGAAPAPDTQPQLRSLEGGGGGEREEAPPARPGSAGARLLATQMAISGATRAEIEQRLRSGFEIDDPSAILDAILGPEE